MSFREAWRAIRRPDAQAGCACPRNNLPPAGYVRLMSTGRPKRYTKVRYFVYSISI
jgi:hypothetical protein